MGVNCSLASIRKSDFVLLITYTLPLLPGIAFILWTIKHPFFLMYLKQVYGFQYEDHYKLHVAGIVVMLFTTWLMNTGRALKVPQWLLGPFLCCVMAMLVAEIYSVVDGFQNLDKLTSLERSKLNHTVKVDYGTDKTLTDEFDIIQKKYHCCGADRHSDWFASNYNNNTLNGTTTYGVNHKYAVPESCCKIGTEKNKCENSRYPTFYSPLNEFINPDGCLEKVIDHIKNHAKFIYLMGILVSGINLLCLIFNLVTFWLIRRNSGNLEQVSNNQAEEFEMQNLTESSDQTTEAIVTSQSILVTSQSEHSL